jgi:hypothetical protein
MSTPEEPARLVSESSGASAELRRALGAARGDLPSPDHVEAMLARFPFPDGGGGGGGGDTGGGVPDVGSAAEVAAGAAKSAAVGKWVGIAFLAASAGTVFYAKTTIPPHAIEPTASAVAVATASASSAVAVIATPEPTAPEPSAIESSASTASATASSAPHAQPAVTASASATESASSGPVRSEIEILKEAAGARGNPGRMLELVNEHARQHPKGMLGQEREMLRIEALVGLGKRAEAKALADAFRKGNPSSAYAERLNQIVPP